MSFLDYIPTVDTCCGCIHLKYGCYIIAYCTIIFATMVPAIAAELYRCYDFHDPTIAVVAFGSSTMYLFSIGVSIYFIYGLCTSSSKRPTKMYLFLAIKAILVTIITAILLFGESPQNSICPDGFMLGVATTWNLFIQSYSFLVVNSYRLKEENIV